MWAGDIALGRTPLSVEGAVPVERGGCPEARGSRPRPCEQCPRGADGRGTAEVHGREPMGDVRWYTEASTTELHRVGRSQMLGGRPSWTSGEHLLRMLACIDKLGEGRVRTPARSKTELGIC